MWHMFEHVKRGDAIERRRSECQASHILVAKTGRVGGAVGSAIA
jgi:hypothetical protein